MKTNTKTLEEKVKAHTCKLCAVQDACRCRGDDSKCMDLKEVTWMFNGAIIRTKKWLEKKGAKIYLSRHSSTNDLTASSVEEIMFAVRERKV